MKLYSMAFLAVVVFFAGSQDSCDQQQQPVSSSGVQKTSTTVATGTDGLTVEQRNVRDRLALDNQPGSIKHLYVISAYSGQVLLYSTVKGKVTSSGKRLSPLSISGNNNATDWCKDGMTIDIGGHGYCTNEVLQDDGTYGNSVDYLYWWDVQGRYHQQYVTGGEIIHISDQPIPVKSVTINLEEQTEK